MAGSHDVKSLRPESLWSSIDVDHRPSNVEDGPDAVIGGLALEGTQISAITIQER